MKKIRWCFLAFLFPLFANAATSWDGWKVIKNNLRGMCLAAITPQYGTLQPRYVNCNTGYKDQHWSFQNGVLTNRITNSSLSDTVGHTGSVMGFLEIGAGTHYYSLDNNGVFFRVAGGQYSNIGAFWQTSDGGWVPLVGPAYKFVSGDINHTIIDATIFDPSVYVTPQGVTLPGYDPNKQSLVGLTGKMNGVWVGGNYDAKFYQRTDLGNGYWDAFIEGGGYVKVVSLQITGNQIKATAAKYRAGNYNPTATDYTSVSIATSSSSGGYGVHTVRAQVTQDINKILGTQSEMTNKLTTLAFLKTIFTSSTSVATLDVANSFWTGLINLPKNTVEIPTGSKLLLKRTALFDTSWDNLFNLQWETNYVAVYNGKTWDISRDMGPGYLTTSGLSLPESTTAQSIDLKGTLNGTWIGGDYAAQTDYLGDNKYNLYLEAGTHTKVVEIQIVNGVVKAVGAKYRAGSYERFASNYINAPLATAASEPGYGVHNATVMFGTYQPKNLDMGSYASSQDQLTNKINSLPFYRTVFSRPNVLTVSLYDGYWFDSMTLPSNTNTLATGSVIKFTRTSGWDTRVNGIYLGYGVTYTWTYNGSNWIQQ